MTSNDKPSQAEGDLDDQGGGHEVLPESGEPSQAEGDDDTTSA